MEKGKQIVNRILKNYYTDKFHIDVGGDPMDEYGNPTKVNTNLTRRLVRKVNIYVSVHDDSCFNYCDEDAEARQKCKNENCYQNGNKMNTLFNY